MSDIRAGVPTVGVVGKNILGLVKAPLTPARMGDDCPELSLNVMVPIDEPLNDSILIHPEKMDGDVVEALAVAALTAVSAFMVTLNLAPAA